MRRQLALPLKIQGSGVPWPGFIVKEVRIDQWLCAARIYKSRTMAKEACEGGRVRLNGLNVKGSHLVRLEDRIEARAPRGLVVLVVVELGTKRKSADDARSLYLDHSPPPPPREFTPSGRAPGSGRPTKAERRALERFFGEDEGC